MGGLFSSEKQTSQNEPIDKVQQEKPNSQEELAAKVRQGNGIKQESPKASNDTPLVESQTFLQFQNALKENDGRGLGVVFPQSVAPAENKIDIDFDPSDKFTEFDLNSTTMDTQNVDSYFDAPSFTVEDNAPVEDNKQVGSG
jgi:hypothetical protein